MVLVSNPFYGLLSFLTVHSHRLHNEQLYINNSTIPVKQKENGAFCPLFNLTSELGQGFTILFRLFRITDILRNEYYQASTFLDPGKLSSYIRFIQGFSISKLLFLTFHNRHDYSVVFQLQTFQQINEQRVTVN